MTESGASIAAGADGPELGSAGSTAGSDHQPESDARAETDARAAALSALEESLASLDVPVHREEDAFLVTLPGVRKYRTLVWLIVGPHELTIESFVCRRPDENTEGVYRYLLQRNGSLRSVAYAIDAVGDIHLVGRIGLSSVTPEEIDTLLGVVLEVSDRDFNPILERGFADAIRREWAWRLSRGDSLKNLQAFRHLIDD